MKFIKIAALSLLALAGNAVSGFEHFGHFPGVSPSCNFRLQEIVRGCDENNHENPVEGYYYFTRAVMNAKECLNAAGDEAAKKACLAWWFLIAERLCAGSDNHGYIKGTLLECDHDISADLEDAAALLEDEAEDKFIAVDAALPEAYGYKVRGRQ